PAGGAMKRRARLRPRGTQVRPGDAPSAPAPDDDRRGPCWELGGGLADQTCNAIDSPEGPSVAPVWLADQGGNAIGSPEAPRDAQGMQVGDGGMLIAAGVAAGMARGGADHGRALRALRTARARRLAIALGLARAARPG